MNGRDLTLGIVAGLAVAGLARRHGSRATDMTSTPAFKRWFGASKVVDERGQPLRVYHGTNAHAYARGERIEAFGTSSRGAAFFSSDPRIAGQYGERVYAVYLRLENPLVVDAGGRGWTALGAASRIEGRITPPVRAALQEREDRQNRGNEEIAALLAEFDDLLADVEASSPAPAPTMRRGIDARKDSLSGYTLGDLLLMDDNDSRETDDVAKSARTLGFDGVIFKNVQDSPTFDAGYSRFLSDIYAVFSPTQIKSATDNAGTFDPADPRINFNRRMR